MTCMSNCAGINEALALTRGDFSLAPPYPFVQLATLKQRAEKAGKRPGGLPPAVRRTGRTEKACIWEITDRTARTRHTCSRRGDLLCAGDAALVSSFLLHAHAV